MSSSLFRQEAVEHQKERLLGEVLLFQPFSLKLLMGIVIAIVILIVSLLFLGSYAKKEMVQGFLVPDKGIAKIYAPQMGTIAQVHVKEGQVVQAGQSLITLVSERVLEGGEDVNTFMLKELNQSEHTLQERLKGQAESNSTELSRLQSEYKQVTEALSLQTERVKITQTRAGKIKSLLKAGHISDIEYQKVYEDHLSQQQRLQELLSSQAKLQSELKQFPEKAQARIAELEKAISDNKQQHVEVQGRRSTQVRAPIAGVVDGLTAKLGQFQGQMQQAQPLLAIIPEKSVLQAEMFVPTRAMGFIKAGQIVRIRYAAFPYQRYGVHTGTVSSISQHILNPNELSAPVEIKEPVYRVVVNLEKQTIGAYGKQMPLQAGMSIDADIILEKQSLFRWILDPIYTLKGKV